MFKESVISRLKIFINPTIPEIGRRYRSAIIVCPGGGYSHLSEREADMVALRYQAFGYQAFVLRYSVRKEFPESMNELAVAVSYIRENAEKWDIDENQIIGCGFSAGGHLVASLGCYADDKLKERLELMQKCNLNGMILCYPVLTAGKWMHEESISNITNNKTELLEKVGLDKKIHNDVPPTFMWHCFDDEIVNVNNTIDFLKVLKEFEIPCECHIFSEGGHGLSLCDSCSAEIESQINSVCGRWFEMSLDWLNKLRIKDVG